MTGSIRSKRSGFALIIALSLMAFTLLLLLAIVAFTQVESQNATTNKLQLEAKQAALLSLNIAIGNLQKVAGHDQRITAPADLLFQNSGPTAGAGRARWYGVWNASDYDQSSPNDKTFMRWLVSSPDTIGASIDVTDISEVDTNSTADEVTIFQGVDSASSVQVPKVVIDSSSTHSQYYAYWIEDEGVKASLNWNQNTFSNDERSQIARLSSSPGADFGVFEGPFVGQVSYPLELNGTNPWLEDTDKVSTPANLSVLVSASSTLNDWLQEKRHDMTIGTLGLLTDVKNGGLRSDLSIAFEMDGEKDFDLNADESDFTNPPTRFIEQHGVFAGENLSEDVFTSHLSIGSTGVIARYVYADDAGAGFTFSGDIDGTATDARSIRGPTWFAMREYANMYKNVSGTVGNYSLDARVNTPGADTISNEVLGDIPAQQNFEALFDRDYVTGGIGNRWDLERPYQSNYMPVLLGLVAPLSVTSSGTDLAISIDPLFFVWNPYNHRLKAERMVIAFKNPAPGQLRVWGSRESADGGNFDRSSNLGQMLIKSFNNQNATNANRMSIAIDNIDLEPGEVKIYYPTSDLSLLNAATTAHRHPYNTMAFEKDTNLLNSESGLIVTKFNLSGNAWSNIPIDSLTDLHVAYGLPNSSDKELMVTFLDDTAGADVAQYRSSSNWTKLASGTHAAYNFPSAGSTAFQVEPDMSINSMTMDDAVQIPVVEITSGKRFFGVYSLITSAAGPLVSGASLNPTEPFAQFNPLTISNTGNPDNSRLAPWNYEGVFITRDFANIYSAALEAAGIVLPFQADSLSNGYWGANYGDISGFGSSRVPMIDVPIAPPSSLAQFAHANLGMRTNSATHAIGNSFASVLIDPVSPYGVLQENLSAGEDPVNLEDMSWLLNDALFDSYHLSGIAPSYEINASGYSATGTIEETLKLFYEETGSNFRSAQANPLLVPYIPDGKTASQIVDELDPETGNLDPKVDATCYERVAAYALIDGAFNVNSTSVAAWAALLRANRGLAVDFASGGSNVDNNGTPFPRGTLPVESSAAESYWSGLERLSDDDIWNDNSTPNDVSDDSGLAFEIVEQVKLRGPFMSLSDFVNHRVGLPKNDSTHYLGALQAAIEASGINSDVSSGAGGEDVNYASSSFSSSLPSPFSDTRRSTTGIYTDITQADLLMPLAPRLSARSDTFRVRAYAEVRSADGSTVVAQSVCEAVLQRMPEYVDTITDPSNNEAWDTNTLNDINTAFGRQFKIVQFRWLDQNEI